MGPPRRAVPGALWAPHHEPAPWGAPIAGASPGDFAAAPPDLGLVPEGGPRGARPPAFGGPPGRFSRTNAPGFGQPGMAVLQVVWSRMPVGDSKARGSCRVW